VPEPILVASIKCSCLHKPALRDRIQQGNPVIFGKGPFTYVKIFRGLVIPIKSCKCDMPWIVLTKNIIWEYNSTAYQGRNEGAQFPGRRITAGSPKSRKMSQALSSIR